MRVLNRVLRTRWWAGPDDSPPRELPIVHHIEETSVGPSVGCPVCGDLPIPDEAGRGLNGAATMPDRFERLVIMNTWLHHDRFEYPKSIQNWINHQKPGGRYDLPDGAFNGLRWFPLSIPFNDYDSGNGAGQERHYRLLLEWDEPVQFIWGGLDQMFTEEWGRKWAEQMNAPIHVLDDANHFFQTTHGSQIVDLVLAERR